MGASIKVQKLLEKRDKLRKNKSFIRADAIRNELAEMGIRIADEGNKSKVVQNKVETTKKSYIVIFGSGEIGPSGRAIHEMVFKKLGKTALNISIISTPAGFQPNVVTVHEEIKYFFEQKLINFHPKVKIIYANNKELANKREIAEQLKGSDYIFIGPGSPTYGALNLKDTLLYRYLLESIDSGSSIALASAAAITFSKYCLPVYEIYKAGHSLHWDEGLNFFAKFYKEITIVPHFNNNEGGLKNDTSFCYMGRKRFSKLLKLIPIGESVYGIDEHSAIVIDREGHKLDVLGKGKLTSISTKFD